MDRKRSRKVERINDEFLLLSPVLNIRVFFFFFLLALPPFCVASSFFKNQKFVSQYHSYIYWGMWTCIQLELGGSVFWREWEYWMTDARDDF